MEKLSPWSLWLAGALALFGALGIASLTFNFLFIRVDALMLVVCLICFANAYVLGKD